MKVTVEFAKILTAIRPELPKRIELELSEGATVADALSATHTPDGLFGVILINDAVSTPAAKLAAGDRILVLPPVSGG